MESPRRKSGIFFALKLRCVDSTVTGWNLVGGRYVVWLKSTKVRQPIFRPGDSGSDDRYDCITEYFKKKWGLERSVSDFIAGMTDKFAIDLYNKIK